METFQFHPINFGHCKFDLLSIQDIEMLQMGIVLQFPDICHQNLIHLSAKI